MQTAPEPPQHSEIPPGKISLADPPVFIVFAAISIVTGLVLGYLCAWMFYEVSHPKIAIAPGARVIGVQIPVEIGIVFILIMAVTGLMIALTMYYVPRWVKEYYESGKMPDWLVWLYKTAIRWKDDFIELNTRK